MSHGARILAALYHRPCGMLPWELCQATGMDRALLAQVEEDLLRRHLVRDDRTGIWITALGMREHMGLVGREERQKEG